MLIIINQWYDNDVNNEYHNYMTVIISIYYVISIKKNLQMKMTL